MPFEKPFASHYTHIGHGNKNTINSHRLYAIPEWLLFIAYSVAIICSKSMFVMCLKSIWFYALAICQIQNICYTFSYTWQNTRIISYTMLIRSFIIFFPVIFSFAATTSTTKTPWGELFKLKTGLRGSFDVDSKKRSKSGSYGEGEAYLICSCPVIELTFPSLSKMSQL